MSATRDEEVEPGIDVYGPMQPGALITHAETRMRGIVTQTGGSGWPSACMVLFENGAHEFYDVSTFERAFTVTGHADTEEQFTAVVVEFERAAPGDDFWADRDAAFAAEDDALAELEMEEMFDAGERLKDFSDEPCLTTAQDLASLEDERLQEAWEIRRAEWRYEMGYADADGNDLPERPQIDEQDGDPPETDWQL